AHDQDDPARVVASGTAQTGEALGTLPDVLLHLLVEEFHVLPAGRLGDAARAEVVEAGRRADGHADPAVVAAVQVVGEAGVGLHLAEQVRFDLVGDVAEARRRRCLVQGARPGRDGGGGRHGGRFHQNSPVVVDDRPGKRGLDRPGTRPAVSSARPSAVNQPCRQTGIWRIYLAGGQPDPPRTAATGIGPGGSPGPITTAWWRWRESNPR